MQAPRDRLLDHLPAAVAHWQDTDPVLAGLAETYRPVPWEEADDDAFTSLVRSIVHQQVSMAAARTIFDRLQKTVGTLTPEAVHGCPEADLRAAGLSGQKVTYVKDLAYRQLEGVFDLEGLAEADDEAATAALVQVRGIGAWSAKMFLLFHLARPDVCPWEDLGVRLAVQDFYGVAEKDAAGWLRDVAQPLWSPYNSLAARVLWTARRAVMEAP